MAKSKAKPDTSLCKGCYLCIGACPKNCIALSGEVNKQGYEYVVVDEENCIGCGQCYVMCPDYVFTIE